MDAPESATQASKKPYSSAMVPEYQNEDPNIKNHLSTKAASHLRILEVSNIATESKTNYKREICKKFDRTGRCGYGEDCIFAHVSKDRNWDFVNEATRKRGICNYFVSGRGCPYGQKCLFLHQRSDNYEADQDTRRDNSAIMIQRTESTVNNSRNGSFFKTKLCIQWWRSKSCVYGARCSYAHGQSELRAFPVSLRSESENTGVAPGTSKKNASPYTAGEEAAQQEAPKEKSSSKWKTDKKIAGIYGDWIDDVSPLSRSSRNNDQ